MSTQEYFQWYHQQHPLTCPCGKLTGRDDREYCSSECKKEYGRYSYVVVVDSEKDIPTNSECLNCGASLEKKNSRKMYCKTQCADEGRKKGLRSKSYLVRHTCVGCGEEFLRPSWYGGSGNKLKYCSNECSHREQKSVRDRFVAELNDRAVVFHSGWELRFYAGCLRYDIPVRRWNRDALVTSVGNYRPDFIVELNGEEFIVEVKGHLDYDSKKKVNEARQLLPNFILLLEEELKGFESTGSLF